MSIFPKKQIKVGDMVIGCGVYGWDNTGAPKIARPFEDPSLVLEIQDSKVLVYIEQTGPHWYDINKLERVYVTDEFIDADRRSMATIEFNSSDQSGYPDDNGDR